MKENIMGESQGMEYLGSPEHRRRAAMTTQEIEKERDEHLAAFRSESPHLYRELCAAIDNGIIEELWADSIPLGPSYEEYAILAADKYRVVLGLGDKTYRINLKNAPIGYDADENAYDILLDARTDIFRMKFEACLRNKFKSQFPKAMDHIGETVPLPSVDGRPYFGSPTETDLVAWARNFAEDRGLKEGEKKRLAIDEMRRVEIHTEYNAPIGTREE